MDAKWQQLLARTSLADAIAKFGGRRPAPSPNLSTGTGTPQLVRRTAVIFRKIREFLFQPPKTKKHARFSPLSNPSASRILAKPSVEQPLSRPDLSGLQSKLRVSRTSARRWWLRYEQSVRDNRLNVSSRGRPRSKQREWFQREFPAFRKENESSLWKGFSTAEFMRFGTLHGFAQAKAKRCLKPEAPSDPKRSAELARAAQSRAIRRLLRQMTIPSIGQDRHDQALRSKRAKRGWEKRRSPVVISELSEDFDDRDRTM